MAIFFIEIQHHPKIFELIFNYREITANFRIFISASWEIKKKSQFKLSAIICYYYTLSYIYEKSLTYPKFGRKSLSWLS